ncbi:nuclear transport factor 2 family protein [Bradyrhizobium sp. CB1650]|uniref:nuclear transport factor 2 family protein n=1 Tax=Bradyrhizobium sp. CB1650 TaxID=3039153 RepID=UPI00243499DF|nr:nuclear transport factor 2 family protein [Bradyrhizobium sp. CB1650]WGD50030.1 nuclear transport factor 2 family protein [Bradyrhizobium sp. CB1650]
MQKAVTELFNRYERETNAALAGKPDMEAISDLYDGNFIGASPFGIMTGRKDSAFVKALTAGFDRYRAIGTREMAVCDISVESIDTLHALARVNWRATYDLEGTQKSIDFTNIYLVRVDDGGARVFGWITGDEDAELRRQGIID